MSMLRQGNRDVAPHHADAARGAGTAKRSGTGSKARARWASVGPLIALVVISIIFSVINPAFATADNARTILDQATIPLVLAMGATLVILMGSIDLSIEGVMAASGLTFALLVHNSVNANDFGGWAVVIAVAVGLAFGLASGAIYSLLKIPSFMTTLGIWYIGLGIATVLFGDTVPQIRDAALAAWPTQAPLGLSNGLVVAVLVVLATVLITRFTKLGRNALAIGADEGIARMNSVPVGRYKIYILAFAGLLSGLGGVLATMRIGNGIVEVGSGQLFFTTAAVVVGGTLLSGGRGGPLRSVVGVLLLTVINNGLVLAGASPIVQQAIAGLVIIAAVILAGLRQRSRLRIIK